MGCVSLIMPFGLYNAPATFFERLMEFVLQSLVYGASLVYLVDVTAIDQMFQKQLDNL
jgi:hypothetical protein